MLVSGYGTAAEGRGFHLSRALLPMPETFGTGTTERSLPEVPPLSPVAASGMSTKRRDAHP